MTQELLRGICDVKENVGGKTALHLAVELGIKKQ